MPDRIVFGDKDDGRRIAERADISFQPGRDVVIAHVRDGHLTGGVILNGFTDASCLIHVAGFRPRWGSRDLLWVAFDYPFRVSRLERVFTVVPEFNRRSLRFAEHIGFRQVARVDHRYKEGKADLNFAIERRECRWLAIRPRTIPTGG
jgi:RimJ/RimL family protein N-acetyltransferase